MARGIENDSAPTPTPPKATAPTKTTTPTKTTPAKPTETIKAPVPGQTQYVGGQLQYVSPTGTIQAPNTAPATPVTPATVTPAPVTPPPPKTQTWTASDGTIFTDQGAFATYSAGLATTGAATTAAKSAKDTADAAAAAAAAKTITDKVTADAQTNISNMNALQLMKSTLSGYNIDPTGAISDAILTMQQRNYDTQTIQALTQDPASENSSDPAVAALATAWNTRFSGNKALIANGQNPLSPAEYISTENSYRNILNAAGVPRGFYSSNEQLGTLIGNSIAPTEVQDRVDTAAKSISNQDPYYAQTLQNYWGLTPGDMIAHALDPATALPLLQRQVAAATFGAAGARQGLSVDQASAQQYAALGITQSQAEQGFNSIGQALPTENKLAQIYNQPGNEQADLTAATFGGADSSAAALRLKQLQQQEINAYSGSSGVDKNSLNQNTATAF